MLVFAFTLALAWIQTNTEHDSALIQLARSAVKAEVHGTPMPALETQSAPRAVFVTIERDGKILGCRGDLNPKTVSLEQEVVLEARAAAAHDPRYRPIRPEDLKNFLVTVTVVGKLEPIANVEDLQPSEGLVLESGSKKGIVLPWEGKDSRIRLKWAYKKAGVPEGSSASLYRLIATRCRG